MTKDFFQHRFDNVEDYLHHRPPYLMVEEIVAITDEEIRTSKTVPGQDGFLKGHFPGAAVFPGAMMQELVTQSAGILIAANYNPMKEYNTADPHFNEYALGVLIKVQEARYRGFARPGDRLDVEVKLNEIVDSLLQFSGKITVDGRQIMRIQFLLSNIKSSLLTGNS